MKRNRIRNVVIVTGILIFTGAGIALAQGGWGYGGHMRGNGGGHMMGYDCPRGGYGPHMGYGGHMRGYGGQMRGPGDGSGYGGYNGLSQEDYQKLEAARDKFFDETRELRRELDDKRYAMQKELAKEDTDRDKVKALQQDISKLRSEFDDKALEHRLEVRDIVPESARGGRGYARGYGRGGYCW